MLVMKRSGQASANRGSELEELFAGAIERPRNEWGEFLDAACPDAGLRLEVEALLHAHEAAEGGALPDIGRFEGFGGPVAREVAERMIREEQVRPRGSEESGKWIDRYRLLEEIGEGGFGTVWMAEQREPVRRRVALKIVKLGMDTRQVVARFEQERQALAMMEHPNIAKVLDGGVTEQGRPFFVMELVRGTPITQFCDREKLDTPARLRLFTQVCRAVQHAHQKGVIHRDLKPGNILVTVEEGAEPVPKVIDFGVAKAVESNLVEKTLFTRFGQMVGTPSYMSPEQAGADAAVNDIDTRTDIFALGVLLYELLTGSTPFEAERLQHAALGEVQRILREREAPRPSTRLSSMEQARRVTIARERGTDATALGRSLRGDLDWIVMKAIEKDRRRRYETANGLALDVERFLNHEAVDARPPSTFYRLRKLARRHKVALTTLSAIAGTLVAGVVTSTLFALRAHEAEQLARQNFSGLQKAYDELELAKQVAGAAHAKGQALLVQKLLEEGTGLFNEGELSGLLSLSEAVDAADGDPGLEAKALELWNLAHAWLPGSVESVMDLPYAIAISPDGSLVVWCDARQLCFYRTADRSTVSRPLDPDLSEVVEQPNGDHFCLLGLAFSRCGRLLALHNPQFGVAQVWDVGSRRNVTGLLRHPGDGFDESFRDVGLETVCFNPDATKLATVASNGTACLWDIGTGTMDRPAWTFNLSPRTVAFSPDGRRLGVGHAKRRLPSTDPNVFVFDLANPERASATQATHIRANQFRFIDEQQVLIRGTSAVYRWDLGSGQWEPTASGFYEDLDLSPDRSLFAAGSRDGRARLFSASSLELISPPLDHGGSGVRSLAFGRDGSTLITGGLDGSVQTWSLGESPRRIAKWPQPGSVEEVVASNAAFYVSKSRHRGVMTTGSALLRRLPVPFETVVAPIPDGCDLMDVTPDGSRVLLRSADRTGLLVVELGDQGVLGTPVGVLPLALRSESRQITSGSLDARGERCVFAIKSASADQAEYFRWEITGDGPVMAFFKPDADAAPRVGGIAPRSRSVVATFSADWQVNLVDFETGLGSRVIPIDSRVAAVSFSGSVPGCWIASRQGTIYRCEADGHGEVLPEIRSEASILSASVSGDGDWILAEIRRADSEEVRFKAWFVGGPPPYLSIEMPTVGRSGGRVQALHSFELGWNQYGRPCPVGDRSFVFQRGADLVRLDLPTVPRGLSKTGVRTQAALGVRRDDEQEIRLLRPREFEKARLVR